MYRFNRKNIILLHLLKENHLLRDFFYELYKTHKNDMPIEYFINCLNTRYNIADFLSYTMVSFSWCNTILGYDVWKNFYNMIHFYHLIKIINIKEK